MSVKVTLTHSAVNLLEKAERKVLLVVGSLLVFTVKPPGEDSGNYICMATSAEVFHIEAISFVEVRKR